MSPKKYRLADELQFFERFSFENLKITMLKLSLASFAGAVSCALSPCPSGVTRARKTIPGYKGRRLKLTLYEPESGKKPLPCLVYLHGGGFMLRDFPCMHKLASIYSKRTPCTVLFVHYSLAPRHPFPAALEDSYSALLWAYENADELGIDRGRIAVGGDSAGGALAAALTHMTRDRAGPRLMYQMLIYPVTDAAQDTESMRKFCDTPGWNANLNRQMWGIYLKDGCCGMPSYASPMQSDDFSSIPPAYVEVEEFDCLRDEGIAYAEKLAANGVDTKLRYIEKTFHGFDAMCRKSTARRCIGRRVEALRAAFYKE